MKLLIVDNNTQYLQEIKEVLKKYPLKIIKFKELKYEDYEEFTHVILTGGDEKIDLDLFKEEVNIIKNSNIKILGICFGHQLISKVFGAEIIKMPKRRKGSLTIKNIQKGKFLGEVKTLTVYENHSHIAEKIKNPLKEILKSEDGCEAIKHISREIYGVQFHPEKTKDGIRIMEDFLNTS